MKEQLIKLGLTLYATGYKHKTYSKSYNTFTLSVVVKNNRIQEVMVENKGGSGFAWYYVTLKENPSIEWLENFDKLMIP